MTSRVRKFYISHHLEIIISKYKNKLIEKNQALLEKQIKKQSQTLQKYAICENDVLVYEHHSEVKSEMISPVDLLEVLNRACNFYETMWDVKTSKLRTLHNAEERSIIRNEIKYVKMNIDKLVEDMILLMTPCQEQSTTQGSLVSLLDTYIEKYVQ